MSFGTLMFTFRDGTTTSDTRAWAEKFEDQEYRTVSRTTIRPGVEVSTIWQGIPSLGGEPNNYETLIMGGPHHHEIYRYTTEQEAIDGHNRVVSMLTEENTP